MFSLLSKVSLHEIRDDRSFSHQNLKNRDVISGSIKHEQSRSVSLKVAEGDPQDSFRPIARIDQRTMTRIGAAEGDTLDIVGKRRSVARCMPFRERDIESDRQESEGFVRLTNVVRNNAEVALGGIVSISR